MATILHRIKAFLYENLLTKDNPNDFVARRQRIRGYVFHQSGCVCRIHVDVGVTSEWMRRSHPRGCTGHIRVDAADTTKQ
jgi:hypothetical protein